MIVLLIVYVVFFSKKKGTEVEADMATKRTLIARVSESGVIQPDVEVPIAPDVSGEVVSLHVAEGDYVRRGQLLFTIRPDNLKVQYEQANAGFNSSQADYGNAKANYLNAIQNYKQDSINLARNSPLFQNKVISQADFENFRLRAEVSRNSIESTKQLMNAAFFRARSSEANMKLVGDNLSRTSVHASMDGIVTKMTAQLGQRVVGTGMMSGTEVIKIADLTRMEVAVDINENDIVNIQVGDTASIEVDAYPDIRFRGIVSEVGYSANVQGTGSTDQITNYPVKVAIVASSYPESVRKGLKPNQGPFRPSMSAMCHIYTDRADSVVSVPIQAVTLDKSKAMGGGAAVVGKPKEIVYVLDNGKAKAMPVKTGISDENFIEVKEGLIVGDKIVTGPYTTVNKLLTDGMDITVKEKKERKGKGEGKPEGKPEEGKEKKEEKKAETKPADKPKTEEKKSTGN